MMGIIKLKSKIIVSKNRMLLEFLPISDYECSFQFGLRGNREQRV